MDRIFMRVSGLTYIFYFFGYYVYKEKFMCLDFYIVIMLFYYFFKNKLICEIIL